MLKIDPKRHRSFEDEYAEVVKGVISRLEVPEEYLDNINAVQRMVLPEKCSKTEKRRIRNLRAFYEKISEYGLCEIMNLDMPWNPGDMDELDRFVKDFILSPVERIRKAAKHLKALKDNPEEGFKDYSKDKFLEYYRDHAYSNMCKYIVGDVKCSIRIVKSLGIKVCPYCGCAYIGGRGKSILGAELDHFFNKEDYPFFALCLYNLVPSCASCNNHKRMADSGALVSPFETQADFDSKIGIRLYSRPYISVREGQYYKSRMKVINTVNRNNIDEFNRYNENTRRFALQDIYEEFETDACEYVDRMVRYPRTQVCEIEDILALNVSGIESWRGRIAYRHKIERDLFLDLCAEGDKQAEKLNSKMYTDLYRVYRRDSLE